LSGQGRQSGVPELAQELGNAQAQRRRPLADLKRGKSMDMNAGDGGLYGAADVDIGAPRILRMDSTLQAHLGRSTLPRFAHAPHDFGEIEDVGGSA
jgi:hypothetical protein